MTVPATDRIATGGDERHWAALDPDEKRARVLDVADELFAREGIDVAMPVLADAIGVGVGSIYRQIGRKEDILAALIAIRIERVTARFEAARDAADPWAALCALTHAVVEEALTDCITQQAWLASQAHPAVAPIRLRAAAALDALVERAREQGALHPDATADDLRLVFRAVQEVEGLGPGGAHRLAEVVLRGLAADAPAAR